MKDWFVNLGNKLREMRRFVKNNFKLIVSVVVVILLAVACLSSVISEQSKKYRDTGRMIALTPLYEEPAMAPAYARKPYSSLELTAEAAAASGFINEGVGAYSDSKKLTEQEQKDKAALEALLESSANAVAASSTARDEAEARLKKYQLNKMGAVNSNPTVTITPTAGSYAGQTANPTYANNGDGTYLGNFLITAYCPCAACCGKTDGITACGTHATANHTIAADSRFAFGTKMIIMGQVYTVEDRGGAIVGNHIDMYFNTHSEALAWGKQYADVYLYTGQ
ncbi:MAG: 3D domain-containing protein [Eubacterium sp.]|nr:3D domain-containing protein [Eubacterium sp.]